MIDMQSKDLSSLWAWMKCLVERTPVNIQDLDVAVHIFGEQLETYLVINKYKSNTESTQYVLNCDNKASRLSELLEVLKMVNYDVVILMETLEKESYSQTEMGEVAKLGKLRVTRTSEKANQEVQ